MGRRRAQVSDARHTARRPGIADLTVAREWSRDLLHQQYIGKSDKSMIAFENVDMDQSCYVIGCSRCDSQRGMASVFVTCVV